MVLMDKKLIAVIQSLLIAGVLVSGGLYLTGNRDLCADGMLWTPTGTDFQYNCASEEKDLFCLKLSSSKRTCYILEFIQNPIIDEIDLGEIRVFANAKEYICEGREESSRCQSGPHEAYYGELV